MMENNIFALKNGHCVEIAAPLYQNGNLSAYEIKSIHEPESQETTVKTLESFVPCSYFLERCDQDRENFAAEEHERRINADANNFVAAEY